MKKSGIISWLVVLAFALVIALVLLQPFEIGDTTISIGSDAKSLLEQLGTPDGATAISNISVDGPDGPMPEIASRSFTLAGSAQTTHDFYRRKCKAALLGPPGEDLLKLDPAAICERNDGSGALTVFLFSSCPGAVCNVSIEVRHHVMAGNRP